MPKKAKIGKQRKDKYYKLAKETGYRSRASFKLIQLNRKFEFLPKSRVLIDLCAAPGGWLQVAQQGMPVSSVIIGVDLVPIRPIRNVITLQEDITTEHCRQALKRQLKTWKADIVLHDGAPNVGKNWIHDAFSQNALTLCALKLASEMLVKGGWFITKVFRSKDYMSLVWVLKKLFKQVHVTKPQASRNESAEIFVVCQGYLAPARIDPKFLDPSHLFKDVQNKSETKKNILDISDKKPKAEGYDEDAPVYSTLKASDFIFCENHVERLGNCSEIVFDDDDIKNHKLTTEEIKECCKDIKVLGKADLKSLLNWRKHLRVAIHRVEKSEENKDLNVVEVENEEDELDEVMKQAEDLELSKLQEAKKKKKKILKERKKFNDRINLKMIIKDDEPIIDEDRELFRLSQIKNKNDLKKVEVENNLEFNVEYAKTDIENILEKGFRHTFVPYDRHTKEDPRVEAEPEKEESIYSSDEGLSSDLEFESDSEGSDEEGTEDIIEGKKNPLVVDLVNRPDRVQDTVEKWFDKEDFAVAPEDSDLELDLLAETFEKKEKTSKKEKGDEPPDEKLSKGNRKEKRDEPLNEKLSKGNKKGKRDEPPNEKLSKGNRKEKRDQPTNEKLSKGNRNELQNDSTKSEESLMDATPDELQKNSTKSEKNEMAPTPAKKKQKKRKLDPEALALGSLIVQSKKMKRDIIESGYNRYASNDENLPDWFVADEKKHYRKQLPVTAEMVAEYKLRLREINARPIKKVVEAKARKKRRAMYRMEKAKKRAEKVTDMTDMSEREKIDQLKTIYKKAIPKEDRNVTYVVAKKGIGKRVSRPSGVKGQYRVVDKRMKKDHRKDKMSKKTQRKPQQKTAKKGVKPPRRKKRF